jgi:hypothetical protein
MRMAAAGISGIKRAPGAALLPVDDQEVPLQLRRESAEQGGLRDAWAAVNQDERRVCRAEPAQPDALAHAVQHHVLHGGHAAGDDVPRCVAEGRCPDTGGEEEQACGDEPGRQLPDEGGFVD